MALKGLAQFKAEKQKQKEAAEARDRKVDWFNWKHNKNKDKDVVFVRFLQEMDEDVDGYREERGLPLMKVEHQAPGPQGYLRRASCTREEGACYACERHSDDYKLGWKQRKNFYTWALVDYSDGQGPKLVVISRPFNSSFVDDLILEAEDEDNNYQITNKVWRVIRSGSGTSTTWKLRKEKGMALFDDTDVETPNLEDVVTRYKPYEEQAAYYGEVYKDGDPVEGREEPAAEAAPAATKSGELTW